MKNVSEIAINAFKQGSDNYGETPTGEVRPLRKTVYREGTIFLDTQHVGWDHYSCTVILVQPDGHKCTSGIGFYVKDGQMQVCSGHIVFTLPVTDELQAELDTAELSN
jgi:hypothetical protein